MSIIDKMFLIGGLAFLVKAMIMIIIMTPGSFLTIGAILKDK